MEEYSYRSKPRSIYTRLGFFAYADPMIDIIVVHIGYLIMFMRQFMNYPLALDAYKFFNATQVY